MAEAAELNKQERDANPKQKPRPKPKPKPNPHPNVDPNPSAHPNLAPHSHQERDANLMKNKLARAQLEERLNAALADLAQHQGDGQSGAHVASISTKLDELGARTPTLTRALTPT